MALIVFLSENFFDSSEPLLMTMALSVLDRVESHPVWSELLFYRLIDLTLFSIV